MNALAIASRQGYDPNGTNLIYTSENPYVRNANSILPGVDLTAIPVAGRGALISPTTVVRAWHNGSTSSGENYTFIDSNGVTHQRTQTGRSEKIGQDLVLHELDSALPPEIKPMRIAGDQLTQYVGGSSDAYCYRVTYTSAHRLSLGKFSVIDQPSEGSRLIDQDEILSVNSHWVEAVGGDSGGAIFMVVDGEAIAISATLNTLESGTSISAHNSRIDSFDNTVKRYDFYSSAYNETPPVQPPRSDDSTTYIHRKKVS
jgi:hypothetical protein